MKNSTVGYGVIAAIVISLAAWICFGIFTLVLAAPAAIKITSATAVAAYLIYILQRTPVQGGKWIALSVWLLVTLTTWSIGSPLVLFVLLQIGLVWLIRSLFYHNSVIAALMDLALTGFAFAAAIWATSNTHSIALAFWTFFLIQALYVLIPSGDPKPNPVSQTHRFDQAHKAAEAALRRMTVSS